MEKINVRARREKAEALFNEGFNCAQAVTLAFSDLLKVDDAALAKLSSSFGGGMGHMREVCGAVSGMCIVTGLLYGYGCAKDGNEKKLHNERIQRLSDRIRGKYGSILCRDLIKTQAKDRPAETAGGRPCTRIVGDAAEALALYIEEHGE